MCNCGKNRAQMKHRPLIKKQVSKTVLPPVSEKGAVLFEYTGKTALTISGSTSRKIYRFNFNGDVQPVDHNDVAFMMGVPVLKKHVTHA